MGMLLNDALSEKQLVDLAMDSEGVVSQLAWEALRLRQAIAEHKCRQECTAEAERDLINDFVLWQSISPAVDYVLES